MTWDSDFSNWREGELQKQMGSESFSKISHEWMQQAVDHKYSYQFDWLGVPIIQMPSDLVVFQQIIFETRPDLIIETGVARGGSLVFWASMLDLCGIDGRVIGVDIEVREHAKNAISNSKYSNIIDVIVGSSIDNKIIDSVRNVVSKHQRIMVVLDSNHTHEHVLGELNAYAEFVSPGCSLLVLDTVIDDLIPYPERSWGPGSSPKSAVIDYMKSHSADFKKLSKFEAISKLTVAPHGFWMRS